MQIMQTTQIRHSLGMVSRKEPFVLTNEEKAQALSQSPWLSRFHAWQAPKHIYLVERRKNEDGCNSVYEITDKFVIAINEPNERKAKETVATILQTLERANARKKIYSKGETE